MLNSNILRIQADPVKTTTKAPGTPVFPLGQQCYNVTSSSIIYNNCTCSANNCVSISSCPCQQTFVPNCACIYLSIFPCFDANQVK